MCVSLKFQLSGIDEHSEIREPRQEDQVEARRQDGSEREAHCQFEARGQGAQAGEPLPQATGSCTIIEKKGFTFY